MSAFFRGFSDTERRGTKEELAQLSINTIRILSMDAVQQAVLLPYGAGFDLPDLAGVFSNGTIARKLSRARYI